MFGLGWAWKWNGGRGGGREGPSIWVSKGDGGEGEGGVGRYEGDELGFLGGGLVRGFGRMGERGGGTVEEGAVSGGGHYCGGGEND